MSLSCRIRFVLFGFLLWFPVGFASANTFMQVTVGANNEDNVSRGLDAPHILDDNFLSAGFTLGKLFQTSLNSQLVISGTAATAQYVDLDGWDKYTLSVSADYGYKLGFGAYAPRVGANLTVAKEFLPGRARDVEMVVLELSYSRRIDAAWWFSFGVDYQINDTATLPPDQRLAALGYAPGSQLGLKIFDYEAAALFGTVEYAFESGLLFNGSYRRVSGATVASTTMPDLKIYKISDAFYPDPAFAQGWFAYQLAATIDEWSLGVNLPVATDTSLDLSMQWHGINGRNGKDYDNRVVGFTLVHRF